MRHDMHRRGDRLPRRHPGSSTESNTKQRTGMGVAADDKSAQACKTVCGMRGRFCRCRPSGSAAPPPGKAARLTSSIAISQLFSKSRGRGRSNRQDMPKTSTCPQKCYFIRTDWSTAAPSGCGRVSRARSRIAGFDVVFAQDFEADDNRANLDATIPVHTLGRNHWRSVLNLANVLRTEKPDIALSAVGGSNLKLLLAKSLARSNVRTIITYHGFREWTTGVLSFLSTSACLSSARLPIAPLRSPTASREKLIHRWHARKDRTITILNPVFFPPSADVPSALNSSHVPIRCWRLAVLCRRKIL